MSRKQRRLTLIASVGVVLALAAGLILFALRDSVAFFRSPTEVVAGKVRPGERFRLGGLVSGGSVERGVGERIAFKVTDGGAEIPVTYVGILPDLFREGQGVVAEGVLTAEGGFRADTVLAKHDETYMPREVADALKKQGHWQGDKDGEKKPAGAKP
ncbi:MAG: cytochrome c maturation protein CcmE [Beijerinckiaceae bacterium]